jgi:hypothetical protein
MLYLTKIVAMQRIADYARTNTHFTRGTTSPEKWDALSAKFARQYGTDDSRFTKHRQRKKGQATCVLIGWAKSDKEIHWWLLCTKGRGLVWSLEDLHGFQMNKERRIQITGGYELVHDGASWSWKYTASHYQSLRASIHEAIVQGKDERVQQLATDIFGTAGFRLARQQAGHLVAYMRAEWRRLRSESTDKLALPTRMLYARRLPDLNRGNVKNIFDKDKVAQIH